MTVSDPQVAAATGSDGHAEPRPAPVLRPVVARIEVVSTPAGSTVVVELERGPRTSRGAADGAASGVGVQRAAAYAALRAVESALAGVARLDLEHVALGEVPGGERHALVVVSLSAGYSVERLAGAAVVRDDVPQAVVRAVLAALNRRVEALLDLV